ncbi:MAG TPA: hypothetical protein VEE84_10245, partial [Burkholderiaceae bacterium]|nr:hypothetical protein [Burkholderiaceae bacterium]
MIKNACSFLRPVATALVALWFVPLLALAGDADAERGTGAREDSPPAASAPNETGNAAAPAQSAPCPTTYGASGPMTPIAPALASAIRERVRKKLGGSVS